MAEHHEVRTRDINSAFFAMLENLPLVQLTAIATVLLVALFFISGADANTFVLSMLSSKGTLDPGKPVLVMWGGLTGACAVLLLVVGGLTALQQAAMLSALPFTLIVALLGASLIIELRRDHEFTAFRHARLKDLPVKRGPSVKGSDD
ncbi:BCCT family transporter [Arthrobacter mangrovi]|uniref:BCCT family transporter n=1 Tax=Arthrobacter mangrovi TaxID=2966350 RepID=UPI0022305B5E|nr:BCCT family transporter [Arthrobacter mangrovi]